MKNNKSFFRSDLFGCILTLIGIIAGLSVPSDKSFLIGLAFVIGAAFVVWTPAYSNAPKKKDLTKNLVWEKTDEKNIDSMKKKIAKCKKSSKKTVPFMAYLILTIISVFAVYILFEALNIKNSAKYAFSLVIYLYVIIYAKFCSGKRTYYYNEKLESSISQQLSVIIPENWTKEYSVLMAKNVNVPLEIKTTLKPKEPCEFLYGIQIQTAINNGPDGECPYTYCVIIGKKGLNLKEKFPALKKKLTSMYNTFIISDETKPNDENEITVLRCEGYKTYSKHIQKLTEISLKAWEILCE